MSEITIEIGKPYEAMLEKLRQNGQSDPDADIRKIVEDAIHNGYQQSQAVQE